MSRQFENVLDDCLTRVQAGSSVEEYLATYPKYAEALRPLLSMASAVQGVPVPRPEPAVVYANQQRMLDAVQAKAVGQQAARRFFSPRARKNWPSSGGLANHPFLRTALTMVTLILVVALGTGGLVTAAADTLPGDSLYSVKRIAEKVRLSLTFDTAARQQFLTEFAQARQDEVWAVLEAGRSTIVDFQGLLEKVDVDFWLIDGLRVDLDNDTVIKGDPVVGAMVVVRASSPGDGTLRALRLRVQAELASPTSTAGITSSPTPTSTPLSPTPTKAATQTPTRMPEPIPSAAATASQTSLPTGTEEPEPTDRPEPRETEEAEPTDRPEPPETEEPEGTDHLEPPETQKPEATDHLEPSETEEPEPTDDPEPPDKPDPTRTEEPDVPRTPDPEPTDD
jgi:hypothetical protein